MHVTSRWPWTRHRNGVVVHFLDFCRNRITPIWPTHVIQCCFKLVSFFPSLSSGVPLQLDRFLPVFLSDHISSWPLRGHLRLWPLPHQMDPHSPGMRNRRYAYKRIKRGFMYAQTTQEPQTPLWHFNVVSVVVGLLELLYFLKELLAP